MKKYLLIFIPIIILLIGVFAYVGSPRPIIASPYTVLKVERTITSDSSIASSWEWQDGDGVAVTSVYYNRSVYNSGDVTDKIDADQLIKILSESMGRRAFNAPTGYRQADAPWEINLVYNGKPMHIVLGNINLWYESSNKAHYKILEPERIVQELERSLTEEV